MYGMKTWGGAVIVAATLAFAPPIAADAQPAADPIASQRAAELDRRANEMMSDVRNARRASDLFREASAMHDRPQDAVKSMLMAGRTSYYAGRTFQALEDLTAAGEMALDYGDVLTAAKTFLDAAWLAAHRGDAETVETLTQRAKKLSLSPLLAAADRADLERRIQAGA
jgi:hypothetical protein